MAIFDWFRKGKDGDGPTPMFCPFCGSPLRSTEAKQCFECGADWHDPSKVVQAGEPTPAARQAIEKVANQNPGLARESVDPVEADDSVETIKPTSEPTAEPTPEPVAEPAPTRKPGDLSYLNASQFAPISDEDLKQQASQLGDAWGNPWFGRRDIIPPASDARTSLIDRAMIAHGMISPEELEEIHRVGEEMDQVRPDLAKAAEKADAAVARTEEEREQLKQKKKAEAEERRRLHAEGVAHRRATDIVFLGRDVSGGLHDRTNDENKLRRDGLPVLSTPADVAEAMGIDIPKLRWLAFHNIAATRTHYIHFNVPKKSGGTRQLAAPHRTLAKCQQWILRHVLDQTSVHRAAHGFVRDRSTVTGAREHIGQDVVLNLDLEDFFPTVTFRRVRGAFRQLGYSPAVATIFALLCTEAPRQTVQYDGKTYYVATGERRLPQGACTSPAISNLVSRRMDARLLGICSRLGWKYTRYADDLSFSASGDASKLSPYLMARVRHIADDEGFAINEKKTRLQGQHRAQMVTGIVVNKQPSVSRKTIRRVRAILHRAKTQGLAAQNRDDHPNFEGWVRGMVAYIFMVNPNQGRKLREALDSLSLS